MSGYELCEFVLRQMGAIIGQGLLASHKRVEDEFKTMFLMLATSPRSVIDRLLPWIKVKYHQDDFDIVVLSLYAKEEHKKTGPQYFVAP